jgi:hypothetical protein
MMRAMSWSRVCQAAVAIVLAALCSIATAHAQALSLELIASGLPSPVGLRNAGDGSNRLFIVNQGGTISIYQGGQVLSTPFLDVSSETVYDAGERGLLGLAFDPNYATNGFFYIYYTSQPAAAVTISRFSVSANPNVADPNSEVVLKTQAHSEFENTMAARCCSGRTAASMPASATAAAPAIPTTTPRISGRCSPRSSASARSTAHPARRRPAIRSSA